MRERLDQNFFRVRFDRLTPREKAFLRAMAELGAGPYRTSDIAAGLGGEDHDPWAGPCHPDQERHDLQPRPWGNPYLRILRSQLENLIAEKLGSKHLDRINAETEMRKVKKEIALTKKKLCALQLRQAEIERLLHE